MSKYVRLFFNRKKKATTTVAGAIEIVVCLQRERCYFHSGHNVTLDQWENGMVVNHPRAVVINEEIQKKVTEFEHILIAMQVNKDDMTIAQFKTYLSADGGEGVEFPFFIFSILVFPTFFLCVFPSGRSFSFQWRKKVGLRTNKVLRREYYLQ